ncbi:MAG TPA: DNA repair protein RecN [Sphaerochaeta sp.]|nr:DNA repair protein RecN [Sphaerochaeta sp.]
MLERLDIHHYALIDDVTINFGEGFSVITGETGAGKSIILGAIALLFGERSDTQAIRSGCEAATVSASFFLGESVPPIIANYLEENDLELDDGSLLLSRNVRSNGRSSATIQGRGATRGDLTLIGEELLDISAQRDHQSLLSSANQLLVLDAFGNCKKEKEEYQELFKKMQVLEAEQQKLKKNLLDSAREAEFLKFAVDEISKANAKVGEDDELAEQIRTISSFEQIYDSLSLATALLHGSEAGSSLLGSLHQAGKQIGIASKSDTNLSEFHQRLESSSIELEDIYESLRDYLSAMSFSQMELDQLQGRLALLQRLKKKYGHSLEAMLTFKAESEGKLMQSEQGEDLLLDLEKKLSLTQREMLKAATVLTEVRKRSALVLQKEIEETLRTLGMKEALFSISVMPAPPSISGSDSIDFMICANPGLESRPIKDVASGGELSRIMLALKTTLSHHDKVGTLIFDEVDAGIGGSVALSVAKQLKKLSKSHQVLVITHLASIASQADAHLVVSKEVYDGMSFSHIQQVHGPRREQEIARMLSGDDESEVSLVHAKQMLNAT